jgi:hypothetical protein
MASTIIFIGAAAKRIAAGEILGPMEEKVLFCVVLNEALLFQEFLFESICMHAGGEGRLREFLSSTEWPFCTVWKMAFGLGGLGNDLRAKNERLTRLEGELRDIEAELQRKRDLAFHNPPRNGFCSHCGTYAEVKDFNCQNIVCGQFDAHQGVVATGNLGCGRGISLTRGGGDGFHVP